MIALLLQFLLAQFCTPVVSNPCVASFVRALQPWPMAPMFAQNVDCLMGQMMRFSFADVSAYGNRSLSQFIGFAL
eukprot:1055808-Amphidinium_carterae.1